MATNTSDVNASVIMTKMPTTTIEQYFSLSFYICVAECCLSPFILLGNGLTVVVVTRYLKTVTPTHVAVTYLAVADFTVGMMSWFHLTTYLTQGDWKHWRNWCKFAAWCDYASSALNTVAVMLVAIERCVLITKWDFYKKHYTVRKQKIISAASASFVLLTATADIALSLKNPKFGKCYFDLITNADIFAVISRLMFATFSFILVFSYVRIIRFLWKQRRSVVARQQVQNRPKREKKTTTLMALIVSIYLSTTVPVWIYPLTLSEYVTIHQVGILDIFIFIYYCNALVNPILYAARIPVFKEACGKIFSRIFNGGRNRDDVLNEQNQTRSTRLETAERNNGGLDPRRNVNNVFVTSHM